MQNGENRGQKGPTCGYSRSTRSTVRCPVVRLMMSANILRRLPCTVQKKSGERMWSTHAIMSNLLFTARQYFAAVPWCIVQCLQGLEHARACRGTIILRNRGLRNRTSGQWTCCVLGSVGSFTISALMRSSTFMLCWTTCFQTSVDSASLHSLRGRPFSIQFGDLQVYTRRESCGLSLSSTSRGYIRLLHSWQNCIEVLRSSSFMFLSLSAADVQNLSSCRSESRVSVLRGRRKKVQKRREPNKTTVASLVLKIDVTACRKELFCDGCMPMTCR